MNSLRARAVTAGILWAFVVIVLGLTGLASYMTSQSQERFLELLQTRHTQVVIAVVNENDMQENLSRVIGDPEYQRKLSGQYWQVSNNNGQIFAAPSLGGAVLPIPDTVKDGIIRGEYLGPNGEFLISLAQWITLEDGSQWHVQVATSLQILEEEDLRLRNNLLTVFAFVSGIGVLGALALVAVVLQPLNTLRKDVSARWEHEDGLDVESYPIEVAPLVNDINILLDRNREILRRSRRQAADLAHAIKTPSAIMRNELDALAVAGTDVCDSINALDRLDAQLKRSFARIRADGIEGAVGTFTDLDTSLDRMQRAFTALADNVDKQFTAKFDAGLRVRMDQSDFEEVIGNLLDNAVKWSKSRVELRVARSDDSTIHITITDDGPGISDEDIAVALNSRQRFDSSKPGTGLGLAIAADLVQAYGGEIDLGRSQDLGGLKVDIRLPVTGGVKLASDSK